MFVEEETVLSTPIPPDPSVGNYYRARPIACLDRKHFDCHGFVTFARGTIEVTYYRRSIVVATGGTAGTGTVQEPNNVSPDSSTYGLELD